MNRLSISTIKTRIGLYAIVLMLGLSSCVDDMINLGTNRISFMSEYSNAAWGVQHFGFIILLDGSIYTFDRETPWIYPKDGIWKTEDLANNLRGCKKVENSYDLNQLKQKQLLAIPTLQNKLSNPTYPGADRGVISHSVLCEDADNPGIYKVILLSAEGDMEQHNLATTTDELVSWLKSLAFSK